MIFHKVTVTIKERATKDGTKYSVKIGNAELLENYTREAMQELAVKMLVSNLEHSYITNRGSIQVTFNIQAQQHINMDKLLFTPE